MRATKPARGALWGVARLCVEGGPLRQIWPALRSLARRWLILPGGEAMLEAVNTALAPLCTDPKVGTLLGEAALDQVVRTLHAARMPRGRCGDAAVFVGTPRQARGLSFAATRVLGLAEGVLPAAPEEDPVLPGRAYAVDRPLLDLHEIDRAVRDTRRTLVLSAARLGVDGAARMPSPVLLEVAAALGREIAVHGGGAGGGGGARGARGGGDGHAAVGASGGGAPGAEGAEVAAEKVLALLAEGGWEGEIAPDAPDLPLPGLPGQRAITVAELLDLLGCPQRFLLSGVLGFTPKGAMPRGRHLRTVAHGKLLRRTLEAFYLEHGEAFGGRARPLPTWETLLDGVVREVYTEHLAMTPRVGMAMREQQRERLRRDARLFLAQDWCGGRPRQFLEVEEPFEVALPAGTSPLRVAGTTFRMDVDRRHLLVRDLQPGRCPPRGAEAPLPEHDLPVAMAGLAAKHRAASLGLTVAAATSYAGVQVPSERPYLDDFEVLAGAAQQWLEVLGKLLQTRAFPHTPRQEDCRRCAFLSVCGHEAIGRGERRLAIAMQPALRGFAGLKGQHADEVPGDGRELPAP
ncbi:Hypothetical protein CAP_7862 [Chondromyces apiculatus DSM 436]|uniref:PD-(D/E)XK endonuclease-like domain-containing protein n=2 Tax=Chondromyces apiculatus TaxID=51 RepID=A0A017SY78_9BACT|nr:Hypothetical protein CAP_7862 [Chondromyces apiculatus DSM 436]